MIKIINEVMYTDDYELTVKFTNYRDYEKTRNFICELNRKTKEPTPPKRVSAETEPPKKPQGMLFLAKSNDTMLDVARNAIKVVEATIEVPAGLKSLTVNKEKETADRIRELIGYLENYVEWRD